MTYHVYVESTKRDSCWRCGQPRDSSIHKDPNKVVQATDQKRLAVVPPEPSGPEAANPHPSALRGAQRPMLAERYRTPGHRPSAWSDNFGQALPRLNPGQWVRVRNTGSNWWTRHALVTRLYLGNAGVFKDKWVVQVLVDHPLHGPITLSFRPHELEAV